MTRCLDSRCSESRAPAPAAPSRPGRGALRPLAVARPSYVRGGRPARALPAKRATHSPPPLGALPASRATHSPPPLGAVPGIAQPALPGTLSPAGPLALVVATSYVLGAAAQATGLDAPAWLPPAAGAALGGTFAGLHHLASAFLWRRPASPLSVVITGGTRGLGKALAREFLAAGDSVLISGRSQEAVAAAVADLQAEANARAAALGLPPSRLPLTGVAADVSRAADVAALAARASSDMGGADVWISNAGVSGSYQPLLEASDETVGAVVATNLLGALRSAKAAAPLLAGAPHGRGHFFLIDGAGADGGATPFYAAYGATKAGLSQLAGSLRAELKPRGVSVHCASPGMMITPLLLEGAPPLARQFFNALAEQPEVVAAFLVPRMRSAVARGLNGAYPRFLTPANALWRLLTAPSRVGRFFDAHGAAVYPSEHDRLLSLRHARATGRALRRARSRLAPLAVAYSFSLALSLALVFVEAGVLR